jgi:hypothetical protein
MKFTLSVFAAFMYSIGCLGQYALIYDSIQPGYTVLKENEFYINSNKLVKSDYSGNIIWSSTGSYVYNKMKVEENGIYLFKDSSLTKLDTSGTLLWSKYFISGPCTTQNQTININDVVINGDRIYILSGQGTNGGIWYPVLITLDTSGSFLDAWCGDNYHDVYFIKGIKRPYGGAFIGGFDGGNNVAALSFKINATGNLDINGDYNVFQYPGAQFNFIETVISRNDLSHVYLINSFRPGSPAFPYIVSESIHGSISNVREFATPLIYWGFEFINAATDPQNNLYILSATQHADIALIKTTPAGAISAIKAWSSQLLQSYKLTFSLDPEIADMIFRNDSLFIMGGLDGNTALYSFDSALNTPCYTPDTSVQILSGIDVTTYSTYNYQVFHSTPGLVPSAIQHTSAIVPLGRSLCQHVGTQSGAYIPEVSMYPNPADKEINVSWPNSKFAITLYNQFGQIVSAPQTAIHEKTQVHTAELTDGIYYIVAENEKYTFRDIFLIRH